MSKKNGHTDAVSQELSQLVVPDGWVRTTVGDIGDVRLGRQRSPKNRSKDYATKYLRAANITWNGIDVSDVLDMEFEPRELETYRLHVGDVLLSEASGSASEVGKPAIWNDEIADCCFQNTVIRFRPTVAIRPRFSLLAFTHFARNGVFSRVAKGVGIHHLSADRFSAIPFILPPLAEQDRIVARADELISELDAGIVSLKRVQTNLKRYRASVLKAAVEGKLTEEWRAEHTPKETGEELLKRILEERRQKWEAEQLAAYEAKGKEPPKNWMARYKEPNAIDASELPELPEGWCWASLDQLVSKVEAGKSFKCQPRKAELDEWGVIKVSAMTWGSFLEHEQKAIPESARFDEHWEVKPGDILLSRSNTTELVGASVLVGECRPRLLLSDKSLRLIVSDCVDRAWFQRALSSAVVRNQLSSMATGTSDSMRNVSQEKLRSVAIPLPCVQEQAEIRSKIDSMVSCGEQAQVGVDRGLKRAARLRQSILKDAFEGKLVAQDPADTPASELLARIKAGRQAASAQPTPARRSQRVPKKITERRGAIVAYTIAQSNGRATRKSETLGRTKLVKTLYVAQTHEELDLQFRFQRYAAGPFDEAIFKLEGTANKNDWFITKERESYGVTYHPAASTVAMCEEAAKFLGDQKANIDRLLDHMAKMDMKQAELFATAYAAWNDLLIDGKEVTDDGIIDEFYAWDESKRKFERADIVNQLKWMRSEGYVPTGKGERTTNRTKQTRLPSSKRAAKRK